MSSTQKEYNYPTKKSMRKTGELIDSDGIQDIRITKENGSVLADLPIQASPNKLIPKVFRLPAQALGIGMSTIARMLGLKIVFHTSQGEENTAGK
jgi:hypothetical protein